MSPNVIWVVVFIVIILWIAVTLPRHLPDVFKYFFRSPRRPA
jgi:hypothetical protein